MSSLHLAMQPLRGKTRKVTKAGRTLTVCQGEMLGEQGARRETIALMQATIINIPGKT